MKIAPMKVELLDHMGSDLSVVNAARVSFSKESEFDRVVLKQNGEEATTWTQIISEADTKLINYLAKHNHWTPFGHTCLQFRIKAPIFVARQLVKHQVGLVWNEVSRRYVSDEPEFYFPEVWRAKPEGSIKQGSGTEEVFQDQFGTAEEAVELSLNTYNHMIGKDFAPEQARMVLPQNTMTEWWWTGSVAAFVRVCKLRLDPHAQAETREIAEKIDTLAAPLFPVAWRALLEN